MVRFPTSALVAATATSILLALAAAPTAAAEIVSKTGHPAADTAEAPYSTLVRYLSGRGKDDPVAWEFMVTGGRRSGEWTTIGVPSNWELKGFGTYNYGHDEPKADEIGHYRYRFTIPDEWEGRSVDLVFDGSMTDTGVLVNGQSAGPIHQGGFYRFTYEITDLLHFGEENLLEVGVAKMSANASVNAAERQADFWVFGGIYRPVSLRAHPEEHIERVAVDARHDGNFDLEVDLSRGSEPRADGLIVRLFDAGGQQVGTAVTQSISSHMQEATVRAHVEGIEPWSPEFPNLYTMEVDLVRGGEILHRTRETVGFRTVDVRSNDGIYLNGVKIRLKGVNRHSFWPDAGRTTSRAVSRMDAELIKDMNMNAVRMSHYPPDEHFLDAADSLGLLIIDELTGWQDAYDAAVGQKLVRELVVRDANHPSVILWANGNEGGWNRALDALFDQYDPQKRTVIHPWELFGQINTAHYRAFDCCAGMLFHGRDIFMPTEMLHGLYDGGHGAGLKDFWDEMMENPLAAGGFLWALADEAIVRTDLGDSLDTDGNHAPDGIVGPYREKEGSFYAIKEIWSPVAVSRPLLTPSFDGEIEVENRFHFTNLEACSFEWQVVDFPDPADEEAGHRVVARGHVEAPAVKPGSRGSLTLDLPGDWFFHDAVYLTATDPHGREIYTWTWMVRRPMDLASRVVEHGPDSVAVSTIAGGFLLGSGSVEAEIDGSSGLLRALRLGGEPIPLSNGPRLVAGESALTGVQLGARGRARYVEARYDGDLTHVTWTMLPGGWLELSYRYSLEGRFDHLGVTFDYPESEVRGLRWLGRGPYRVWKNRMQGMEFDVWSKAYNDAITGARWEYPEFKGHHGETYWAVLETGGVPLTFVSATEDLFLRLFTPADGVNPRHTSVAFPAGDISFLNAIPPIGTKFHPADELGPQGAPNQANRWYDNRRVGEYDVVIFIRPGEPAISP